MQSFFLHTGIKGLQDLLANKKIAVAAFLYVMACLVLLYKYGININGEAAKYIDDAHRILKGEPLRVGFLSFFYLTYSLLVSVFIYFSINLQGVALLQILFSLIAACCIYKLIFHTTGDRGVSFTAFIVYLICLPVQKWVFFLYSENLHTSFTVIGFYFFYCVLQKQQVARIWMLIFIFLLVTFSRPVSILFLFTAFIILMMVLVRNKRKIIYYPLVLVFLAGCFLILQSRFIMYLNPDSLRRLEIICQVPQPGTMADYKEYNEAGLSSFLNVISEIGFTTFLENGFKKLGSFFGLLRDFYSSSHNLVLLGTMVLLYPLAIAGLFVSKIKKMFNVKMFSLIYILITSIGIFFTCDEWSNRFMAPVMPHIIILASFGFYFIKNNVRVR